MSDTAHIISAADATEFFEGPELCREYVRREQLWFGTSTLAPGETGGLDAGHPASWEIFYCAAGDASVNDGTADHVLHAGDALAIPPAVPHTITNIGTTDVVIVWSGAPGEQAA